MCFFLSVLILICFVLFIIYFAAELFKNFRSFLLNINKKSDKLLWKLQLSDIFGTAEKYIYVRIVHKSSEIGLEIDGRFRIK